ncbi:MAG: hypothetical protein M3N54_04215 [Acidobacteriota bacterium]|nr:hypothetical protein [Acidobacteriota bacterium]
MALFVDGPSPTVDDLTDHDSGLLDVAQTCGINVSTKLRLAHEEIETDLHLWLRHSRPSIEMVWGPTLRLEQVVCTAPLKRWEAMQALALTYRDAYFSQLVDRYQAKWDEYTSLTRTAYERFVAGGLGLVSDPMPRAAPPVLASVEGPQSGGTFYASVAWVNVAGQEGASSEPSALAIVDGHLMTVGTSNGPPNAAGFNVYAGVSLDRLFLQNNVALPASASFTYVPGATTQGRLAGTGQKPDFIHPLARTTMRG